MKNGLTCLLFTLILIAAPSVIKAQGLIESINTLPANLLSTQQVANDPSPTDSILSIPSQVLSPLDIKNSDATTELVPVVPSLEDQVVDNVPLIEATQPTNVEQLQGSNGNNENLNEVVPATQENDPTQQPVSVNLLGTDISLLGENNSLLKIEQPNNQTSGVNVGVDLPVVGNANLTIPLGEPLLPTENAAGLEITNSPLLGDVSLAVLPTESLVEVGIEDSPLLGDMNLAVLPTESLVEVGIEDTPLLGDMNLAVLPTESLVEVGIEDTPLLGDMNLTILPTESLVEVGIEDSPLLGDMNLAILPTESLVEVGIGDSPLLGDMNLAVLPTESLVVVKIEDSPLLGDMNLEVLPTENLVEVGIEDSPLLGDVSLEILPKNDTDGSVSDISNGVAEGNPPANSDANVQDPSNPDSNVKNPSKQEDVGTGNALLPAKIVNPEATAQGSTAVEQFSANVENNLSEDLETEQNTFTGFMEKQTGHVIRQGQTELENVFDTVGNDSANTPLQIESPTESSTTTSSSSGNGAGGSSSSNGGSGMSAYLGDAFLNEMALSNKVQFVLKELSDEWTKAPPIQPPKAFFFLSV